MKKKHDRLIAAIFAVLTLLFLILAIFNREFLEWAFARHHNQLSWYIRPLFLIPFCYFAFKRSFSGISITIFTLFTSMFWFPTPASVSAQVEQFLQFEVDYLTGDWTLAKILVTTLVPVSMTILALSFWKRNLLTGLSVIVLITVGKMIWSVLAAGQAGMAVIVPAIAGLLLCVGLIYWGYRKTWRKNKMV